MKSIEEILATEYSEEFDQKRKQAMVMGHYKYGSIRENYQQHKCANMMKSIQMRIEKYNATGNTEYMLDIANFAMIEYMCPQHEKAHYRPTDSSESPGLAGMTIKEMERFKEGLGKRELKLIDKIIKLIQDAVQTA